MDWEQIYAQRAQKILVVGGLIGALVAVIASLTRHEDPIPPARVDGIYLNHDCGAIVFERGFVGQGGAEVKYTLETDKEGLFALPDHYVGVSDTGSRCRMVVSVSQTPMYLRFDDIERPHAVTLSNSQSGETYEFIRQRS